MSDSRYTIKQSETLIHRFDLEAKAGERTPEVFELDSNVTQITGILMTSDREDLLFYRGSQQILISGEELVPEGYETKLLMSGLNVAPDCRYHPISFFPGNNQIEVKYQDTDHPKAPFEPYRVTLYVFAFESI